MKRLLLTLLGMVMLIAVHATGFETINGLRYLIDTDDKTATLVADTVKYSGNIVVPEKVTLAGIDYPVVAFAKNCFEACRSLTAITIPSSVTSIGDNCFISCESLTSIDIPTSITSFGNECFRHCTSLTTISLNASVKTLGNRCFFDCPSLTTIDIPSSVTCLGDYCFYGCTSLSKIKIPNSVKEFGQYCFYKCTSLSSFKIPESVISLGNNCFEGCTSLKSIEIPSSITSLDEKCFSGCCSLVSVIIPSSVTKIGVDCFGGCSSLASIDIPSSVKTIGEYCFDTCTSFTYVIFPSSVTEIGADALARCEKLKYVYCYAKEVPTIVERRYSHSRPLTFNQPSNTFLYVPANSVDKYKQAEGWKEFIAILPIKGTEEDTKGKCEKPVITYADGKLNFESSTTGAEYHYTLSCNDVKSDVYSKDGSVSLAAAYNITAYATADDYSPSDKATATLYWINGSLDSPTNINAAKTRGVLASAQDGFVTISGLTDGETVALYTVDGKLIGEARAVNGVASYAVSNVPVVIAKIGGQSIKIAVQ